MKVTAVASMYNEEALLPHFLRHYSCFCDHIVLWDNGSDDHSVEIAKRNPKVEVQSFVTDGYDEQSVHDVLSKTKMELADHDWLLFPDIDEFIMTRPPRQERKILGDAKADVFMTEGYCLVQRAGEPAFDPVIPISRQRRWCYWSKLYSKPIIIRGGAEVTFCPGKHALIAGAGVMVQRVSPFVLVHAETIDFDLWTYRKNRRKLSLLNIEMGWSVARFCQTRASHLRQWQGDLENPLQPVPVPDWGEVYA